LGATEIPYHHKDIIFKSLTEIFANRVLDFYDINTAPIVRAEPANLPTITVQEKTMDFVFYLTNAIGISTADEELTLKARMSD
jgi:hypothetical protein